MTRTHHHPPPSPWLRLFGLGIVTAAVLIVGMTLMGCAAPHAYVGVQNVTPLAKVQSSRLPDNGSGYVNILFPLGAGFSAQVEPILTFQGEWVLRLACDYELPFHK